MAKKVNLKIDWATHEAAKYACENWHYTGKIPVNKLVRVGVCEDQKFVGVVIYGVGASAVMHRQFSVSRFEACELVRVALRDHASPCSRIIAISLKFLRASNPKLKVCVSFADPSQKHHGGIYQAWNWVYTGKSADTVEYYFNGDWRHVTDVYKRLSSDQIKQLKKRTKPGKYRYVMPFDDEVRERVEKLRKPYPKRDSPHAVYRDEVHAPEAETTLRSVSNRERAVQVRPRRSKTSTGKLQG